MTHTPARIAPPVPAAPADDDTWLDGLDAEWVAALSTPAAEPAAHEPTEPEPAVAKNKKSTHAKNKKVVCPVSQARNYLRGLEKPKTTGDEGTAIRSAAREVMLGYGLHYETTADLLIKEYVSRFPVACTDSEVVHIVDLAAVSHPPGYRGYRIDPDDRIPPGEVEHDKKQLDDWAELYDFRPAGSAPANGLVFTSLAGVTATPTRWLVPGRIPLGCVTTIAGYGGEGKSTLMRHVAACITTGRPAFGLAYESDPGDVILVSAEDGYASVVVPHLAAEGADVDRVKRINRVITAPDGKKTVLHFSAADVDRLRESLKSMPDVRAVIIDPIASYSSRSGINPNKEDEMRSILDPLAQLAGEAGIAVILISHYSKGSTDRAANRVSGSTALVNASRMVYAIERDDENQNKRLVVPLKYNLLGVTQDAATFTLTPLDDATKSTLRRHESMVDLSDDDYAAIVKDLSVVEFGEDVDVRVESLGKKAKDPTRVEACMTWVREFVGSRECRASEILDAAKSAGFNFENVKYAKSALKSEGLKTRKVDGTWWSSFNPSGGSGGRGSDESQFFSGRNTIPITTPTTPTRCTSSTRSTSTPPHKRGEREVKGEDVVHQVHQVDVVGQVDQVNGFDSSTTKKMNCVTATAARTPKRATAFRRVAAAQVVPPRSGRWVSWASICFRRIATVRLDRRVVPPDRVLAAPRITTRLVSRMVSAHRM